MSRNDRLMLWGAAAIMVAVGSLSFTRMSQAPAIDPEIVALKQDYQKIWSSQVTTAPVAPVITPCGDFGRVIPEPKKTHEWAAFIHTTYVGIPVARTRVPVFILSLPDPKTA